MYRYTLIYILQFMKYIERQGDVEHDNGEREREAGVLTQNWRNCEETREDRRKDNQDEEAAEWTGT